MTNEKRSFADLGSVGNIVFHINDFTKKFKYIYFMSPNTNFKLSDDNPLRNTS